MANILLKILILSVIGSGIGYITNVIAIKLLFRPVKPFKFLFFEIQGVIPKRQSEISKSIGETVENELLDVEEIIESFVTERRIKELLVKIKKEIESTVLKKISDYPLLMGFKGTIIKYINSIMEKEGTDYIHELIRDIGKKAEEDVDISKIVEEKINSFDLLKVEEIVFGIAKQELRHIEILGAVLGFVIGIVQGIIVHLF